MATLGPRALSSRTVEQLSVQKDTVFWDRTLTGFGVRVYPTGGKVYVAQARGPKGPKRVTVGRHGVLTAEQARKRAAHLIARVKAGEPPVPEPLASPRPTGSTVRTLAKRFLTDYAAVRYKPGTLAWTRTAIHRHIIPALGARPLAAVERAEVLALHHRLHATPASANTVVRTLALMYRLAADWGLVPEGCNPCRTLTPYPSRKRERFLTDAEFTRLGQVLDQTEIEGRTSPSTIAAIRLLMLTGCRKSEILTLRWDHVALDARELRLPDTKTGPRVIALSPMAATLLARLPRTPDSPWVLPGRRPGTHLHDLADAWEGIRTRAGLDDVRIHDLRHSFASRALALGESLPMIGKLLGHTQIETTARYAHLARDSVHDSAARVAESLAADLFGRQIG
ncbi:MAG: site-specific integrase [Thiotrichales bacterium]|nr:site-specific integrase [Thiotrichales bacterium]